MIGGHIHGFTLLINRNPSVREIFGPKGDKVTGEGRKVFELYSSLRIMDYRCCLKKKDVK
jgi:hypothetical protein